MEHEGPELHRERLFPGRNVYPFLCVLSFDAVRDGLKGKLHLRCHNKLRLRALVVYVAPTVSKLRSQQTFETTLATPRYSASALDRDKIGCRFDDHESKLAPI
ncbi:hypothetical protein HanRHA438_Chr07g0320251 [Helianthus annuus]|nr:hypothetical protein HanHA300_Chr07g0256501 [Helianthus annuus]KAJ0564341.1 hypothetical protein HanHA89_Chr07g0273281 [Helianthus annuus]KAJ0909312.1 hypothetical protein HanRHA438_Chr07g0320251 [Helianthus annuus]